MSLGQYNMYLNEERAVGPACAGALEGALRGGGCPGSEGGLLSVAPSPSQALRETSLGWETN